MAFCSVLDNHLTNVLVSVPSFDIALDLASPRIFVCPDAERTSSGLSISPMVCNDYAEWVLSPMP